MKRRGFLGALLAAPIAIKAGMSLPALLKDTPQEIVKRVSCTVYEGNTMTVYDKDGIARVKMGIW